MPPEQQQNQYYEQAKIAQDIDLKQQVIEALPHTDVDFKELEQNLLKKIDEVAGVGKRVLNNREYKHWRAAQEKVREAVKGLKAVQQFFRDSFKVERIKEDCKGVKSGDAFDYSSVLYSEGGHLSTNPAFEFHVLEQDLVFLNEFVQKKSADYPESMSGIFAIRVGEASSARDILEKTMVERFEKTLPAEVKRLDEALRNKESQLKTGLSKMTLLEYSDFETSIMSLQDAVDGMDALLASEGGESLQSLRGFRNGEKIRSVLANLKAMKKRLYGTISFIEPESDRLVLLEADVAEIEMNKGKPGAREHYRKVTLEMNDIVAKQQVERARVMALAKAKNTEQFMEAESLLAAARKAEKEGERGETLYDMYFAATKAYRAATDSAPKDNLPPSGPERKRDDDQRLARR